MTSHRLTTWVGIAFAVLYIPLVATNPTLRSTIRSLDPTTARLWSLVLLEWIPAGVVLLMVLAWGRRTLSSIGFRRASALDLRWALRVTGITGLTFAFTNPLLAWLGLSSVEGYLSAITQLPIWVRLLTALSAGICEELIYRGFLIERLTEATGNLRLASLIGYVAFVLPHAAGWGIGATIQIGLASIAFVWLYTSRRNLPAVMLAHVLNDVIGFVVVPWFSVSVLTR